MNKSTQKIYKNSNYDEKPKKYRISYNALFVPKNKDDFITYKGEEYKGSISLFFKYKFFDGDKEILFKKNDNPATGINIIFNRESGYSIGIGEKETFGNYNVSIFPSKKAHIWKKSQKKPLNIPFEDAVELLKKYADIFDISDNKPTQTTFYISKRAKL